MGVWLNLLLYEGQGKMLCGEYYWNTLPRYKTQKFWYFKYKKRLHPPVLVLMFWLLSHQWTAKPVVALGMGFSLNLYLLVSISFCSALHKIAYHGLNVLSIMLTRGAAITLTRTYHRRTYHRRHNEWNDIDNFESNLSIIFLFAGEKKKNDCFNGAKYTNTTDKMIIRFHHIYIVKYQLLHTIWSLFELICCTHSNGLIVETTIAKKWTVCRNYHCYKKTT